MTDNAPVLLRPGFLVSLKTVVTGGVRYRRQDLDAEAEKAVTAIETASVAKWETVRVVEDAEEHKRASKLRGAIINLVRRHCAVTAFGLLCPEAEVQNLDASVLEARQLVDQHNDIAVHTKVYVYLLKGKISTSDEEAARAIADETRNLIEQMDRSITALDPKSIREAAQKAQQIGAMLAADQAEKVSAAVKQARDAARMIVKRIEKEGEQASVVLADIKRGEIARCRFAFLDLSDNQNSVSPPLSAVSTERFDFLDLLDTEHDIQPG